MAGTWPRQPVSPPTSTPSWPRILLEFSRQQITAEFRGPGRRFAAEQPCDLGRPAADQLAAFLGRAIG
jgi:hypothetical protein